MYIHLQQSFFTNNPFKKCRKENMIFFVVMFSFYLVNTKVPGVKLRMYDQRLSAIGLLKAHG